MSTRPRRAWNLALVSSLLVVATFVGAPGAQASPGLTCVSGTVLQLTPPVVLVGSTGVVTSGATLFADGYAAFGDVHVGDAAAATCISPGGSLLAFVFTRSTFAFTDRVTAVGSPNLVVGGRAIVVSGSAVFARGYQSLADIHAGDFVGVTGSPQADATFLASSVTFGTDSFTGTVQSIGADHIVVDGFPVYFDASTALAGGLGSLADLKLGQSVQVTGGTRFDGSFLGTLVSLVGATPARESTWGRVKGMYGR